MINAFFIHLAVGFITKSVKYQKGYNYHRSVVSQWSYSHKIKRFVNVKRGYKSVTSKPREICAQQSTLALEARKRDFKGFPFHTSMLKLKILHINLHNKIMSF